MEFRELLSRMAAVEQMCDAARQHNDIPLLESAIDQVRWVLSQMSPADALRPDFSVELARCLSLKYRLTGEISALRESIAVLRTAASAVAVTDAIQLVCLNNLGNALADWHQATGEAAALEAAEAAFRRVVALMSDADMRRPNVLSALGDVLYQRYREGGRPALLDEALALVRLAVDSMTASSPGYAVAANNLANVLLERHQITGDSTALTEGAARLRSVLTVPNLDPADHALVLGTLGTALVLEHEATGNAEALIEAERALATTLELTPPGGTLRAGYLNTLGNVYSDRFRRAGDREALDRATLFYRQAVEALGHSDTSYPAFIANLANTLADRYELYGDLPALNEAVALLHQAMDQSAPSGRALIGSNLGAALLRKYQRERDQVVLNQAIYALENALHVADIGDTRQPMILNNLANALHEAYKLTGDAARLRDAQRCYRQAASAGGDGDPITAMALSNLGNVLVDVHQRFADQDALAEGIDALREAASHTHSGHAIRGQILTNLGSALRTQHRLTPSEGLAAEAGQAFAEAAQLSSTAPRRRVAAARAWAESAVATDGNEALHAYQLAVDLLPDVAPHHMHRQDQEHGLTSLGGLAADAAAVALAGGDVMEALRLVESARGVLVSHTIDRQHDLALLQREASDLVHEYTVLRMQLDAPTSTITSPLLAASPTGNKTRRRHPSYADEVERRRELTERWARLLQDIRNRPGLEGFRTPPTAADILVDAGDGPVVVLNVSRYRSDALIILRRRVWSIPLPALTPKSVSEQVMACSRALGEAHNPHAPIMERQIAENELLQILAWLWDAVAQPVLDALAPYLSGTRRIWWVPTGLLSFLPIHAAGHYDKPATTLLDRAVSSYAPTIRSLGHARRRRPSSAARTLLVGMPETPGWAALPVAVSECEAVAQLVRSATRLVGKDAVRQRLIAELGQHQHFHFAGHAHGNLAAPSDGRLLLHDHARTPFTVADVVRLDLTGAELAFLSGCDTALSGIDLADEAINLASAFHLAGFRHVVASLWAINDALAHQVAAPVWRSVSDRNTTASIAAATNEGVRALRDAWQRCPSRWAGYIHVGP
ncbi:CHAT domain-containing protein [Micromonospora sp. M61]|uniref:CHAT domain-containing protein n=1 Tax=Micromonospora sp. M61 TaxID=2824890 RepID=UPI001B37C1F4|nr:CHAT domain-containing protein [Micromonospora sp. M61]MBQ0977865.1 CHAT domain-containing protein [Micromonospora sp. M61]